MDIRIDKKIVGLLIISLLVGGAIGGAIGFAVGADVGHEGEHNRFERQGKFDDHADGEADDDQGGLPNQDEQQPTGVQSGQSSAMPPITPVPAQ